MTTRYRLRQKSPTHKDSKLSFRKIISRLWDLIKPNAGARRSEVGMLTAWLGSRYKRFEDVDVFISNYTIVDPDIYELWVNGHSAEDAVETVHKNEVRSSDNILELVKSDVYDHYRTYNLLEKLLHNPPKLAEQLHFQIEPLTRQLLIEKYYEFDDIVIRELLGRKLSSRYRKDLDEVSEKTGITLKSCRRQFDNVKRIYKVVEDLQGSVIQNIKNLFLLSEDLANLVCTKLKPELLDKAYQELEFNFRNYSRSIITIACNLNRSRELKCLFLELYEKCIEPWKQISWSPNDLTIFLTAFKNCALQLDCFRESDTKHAWERYMTVLAICLLRMYHV